MRNKLLDNKEAKQEIDEVIKDTDYQITSVFGNLNIAHKNFSGSNYAEVAVIGDLEFGVRTVSSHFTTEQTYEYIAQLNESYEVASKLNNIVAKYGYNRK